MTTTYELYTNENGTPKAVEGKAPAIIERVEALDTALAGKAPMSHTHTVSQITDMPKVVFSVNDVTPDVFGNVSVDVGVKTIEGRTPDDNGNISIPFRNVGDEWHSFTGQIPAGGVPYCGQEVTRATYADLWAWVQAQGLVKTESEWQALNTSQNGNVPFYSSGDGSTTFRMPKVVGYIKGAVSQSEAGAYTAEGLPNITGYISDGAINLSHYADGQWAWLGSGDIWSGTAHFNLNASESKSIYGNSDHVTPETSVVLFGVYAFGEITNVGALDADTLATGLAAVETGLATVESNLGTTVKSVNGQKPNNAGNVTIEVKSALPNYSSYVQVSKSDFTPPEDGWLRLEHMSNGDNTGSRVVHKDSGALLFEFYQYRYPGDATGILPVLAGETYNVSGACSIYFHPMR